MTCWTLLRHIKDTFHDTLSVLLVMDFHGNQVRLADTADIVQLIPAVLVEHGNVARQPKVQEPLVYSSWFLKFVITCLQNNEDRYANNSRKTILWFILQLTTITITTPMIITNNKYNKTVMRNNKDNNVCKEGMEYRQVVKKYCKRVLRQVQANFLGLLLKKLTDSSNKLLS